MAKPKKEIETEAKTEEANMVEVKMTEDEKKEFATFMAEKEERESKETAKKNEPMYNGDLRFTHWINGLQYGPGKFRAPYSLALELQNQDTRHYHQRLKEKDGDSFMIDMAKRGVGRITKVESV